jgi:pSer/pThr/pTyr-binding forkhead associated (FHA) protein
MDEYIDVKIDVFEHIGQRASVRKNLTVTALIDEILREFDDISADSPGKYAIYLKGMERPLNASQTLTELDIQPQDELVFDYVRQTIRKMLEPRNYATLREETTGKAFDIQWQPAVIGRPTNEVDHNIVLAVNVQLLPNGMTISRKQAQITFSDGKYFIELLAENNPVYINGKEMSVNSKREIKNGDKLLIGRNKIPMVFLTQSASSSQAAREPRSQPAYPPQSAPAQPFTPPPTPADASDKTHLAVEETPPFARLVIEMAASLQVGQRLDLTEFPCVIGRGTPLFTNEIKVSRRHAEITFDAGSRKFFIIDLQSTNGVILDGVRIPANQPHELRHGTKLGLGQELLMRFET